MFEVKDQATEKVYVIKDCWVEDRPGEQTEHEIVAGIKSDMGNEKFGEHFIDICGHRKMYPSGGFDRVCKILKDRKFISKGFEPELLILAPSTQDHLLQSAQEKEVPVDPLDPRFRYQVVYEESGKSLLEVTSLSEALEHIGQAAEGS